jgi:ABC-type sugar transport system ATPase subunit
MTLQGHAIHGLIESEVGTGPERIVVVELHLCVAAGSTVGIVGATGSGKSTIVKLLLRLYEVQQGRILLDGQPITALRLEDLRRAIGLVSQEVFLFHNTMAENIACTSVRSCALSSGRQISNSRITRVRSLSFQASWSIESSNTHALPSTHSRVSLPTRNQQAGGTMSGRCTISRVLVSPQCGGMVVRASRQENMAVGE